ncbi:MAG: SocA family protein [Bacteroidales bacterium]|nr:SocA family protein [Bacteroidales bacterium]MCF8332890.1 SocA family protein [Bacteroidales bacterium]
MLGFNYKKAVQTLNYFAIKEGGSINKMKAIKLVWLTDRWHLRKYGRPMLMDHYYAMNYGPVPSNTANLADENIFLDEHEKAYRDKYLKPQKDSHIFLSIKKLDNNVFSKTDKLALNKTYNRFGTYNEFELSSISHNYPEWNQYKEILKEGKAARITINYADFFKNSGQDSDFFGLDDEHLSLSKSIFEENRSIYDSLSV